MKNERRNDYWTIFITINALFRKWSEAGSSVSEVEAEIREKLEKVDQEMRAELDKFGKKRGKLHSYLNIARSNDIRETKATSAIPYDENSIKILGLRAASKDKIAAEELYTKTEGMLKGLVQAEEMLRSEFNDRKEKIRNERTLFDASTESKEREVEAELLQYLDSDEINRFIRFMQDASEENPVDRFWNLGTCLEPLNLPPAVWNKAESKFGKAYSGKDATLKVPFTVDPSGNEIVYIDYETNREDEVLGGLQSIVFQTLRDFSDEFDEILFLDPIRYTATGLGVLAPLAESKSSLIRKVANNRENINQQLKELMADLKAEESPISKRLLIVHAFPENYDTETVLQIRTLCANSKKYRVSVFLTHCKSEHEISNDVVGYIKTLAVKVFVGDTVKIDSPMGTGTSEFMLNPAPSELPAELIERYRSLRDIIDKSNDYGSRVGYKLNDVAKGERRLENIPYGVDEKSGKLQTIDFENTNFATFICGASRSGKSTLLHTILTGIMRLNHPDDVEIWLIDFKMTEFSRYIEHTPPHIRYILLDESKELVYDIIDRLTDILRKRQNIFKGKWQKLSEVPKEKYMPAMLIVIDEFSVMSEILADSAMGASDNYSLKLQTLLAKGAALGMHFIFSSQGFTSGTRGLNDFSKKQIQQRVAMKTEFSEIRETLDLKTISEADRYSMENLKTYHTLIRVPEDTLGNHLNQSLVLYIADEASQAAMIDRSIKSVHAKPKYDAYDQSAYIDKQTLIIDGNTYTAFIDRQEQMLREIQRDDEAVAREKMMLYPGEPRRMLPLYAVEIMYGYCENILAIGSLKEKDALISEILSLTCSARLQKIGTEIWSGEKNAVMKKLQADCAPVFDRTAEGLEEICNRIRDLTARIREGRFPDEKHTLIVCLGMERIIQEMNYFNTVESTTAVLTPGNTAESGYASLGEGELDLLQQMALDDADEISYNNIENEVPAKEDAEGFIQAASSEQNVSAVYDARDDIRYILTQGPRLGYHFMVVFHTCMEFSQSRMNTDLFRHKLLLRTPRMDAAEIIGSFQAGEVAELADHVFRYTNGLDNISFRPYLHKGITFEGWRLTEVGVESIGDEEEEYLL